MQLGRSISCHTRHPKHSGHLTTILPATYSPLFQHALHVENGDLSARGYYDAGLHLFSKNQPCNTWIPWIYLQLYPTLCIPACILSEDIADISLHHRSFHIFHIP